MKPPNENPLELVSSLLGACSAAADDQGEERTSRVLENAAATRPCGRAARGAASGEFLHCRHGAGSLPLAALRLQCVGRRRGMKQRNASRISQFERLEACGDAASHLALVSSGAAGGCSARPRGAASTALRPRQQPEVAQQPRGHARVRRAERQPPAAQDHSLGQARRRRDAGPRRLGRPGGSVRLPSGQFGGRPGGRRCAAAARRGWPVGSSSAAAPLLLSSSARGVGCSRRLRRPAQPDLWREGG